MTRYRFAVTFVAAALAMAGCTAGKPNPGSPPAATSATQPPARATQAPPDATSDDIIIARRLDPTPDEGYSVIFGATGELMFNVPDGAVANGFRRIATATTDGATTSVRFLAGEGGELREEQRIEGSWQLPKVGVANLPAGISADGSTVVLEQPQGSSKETAFAVVKAEARKPRVITFRGDMSFDALSPDGSWLYLIDHRPGGVYQVRRADTATGALEAGVIVDKRNPEEVMSGYAITQLAGRDSWVYTLYQGPDGPFVHALQTDKGAAACIDLPEVSAADQTHDATAAAWGLAQSSDGFRLYATNSAIGTVNAISLEDFTLRRTATLTSRVGAVTLAKFENGIWNDAGSAAVSPDNKVLYVGGPHGVDAVATGNLSLLAKLGGDRGYRSLAVAASGQLYAVDLGGQLHRLGSAAASTDVGLAEGGFSVIEGVLTLGG
jgi:hypothetical protein